MEKAYIKLGPKAASFYDPRTRLQLCHGEVKEVESWVIDSPKVNQHLLAGGLKQVQEKDFLDYKEALEASQPAVPKVTSDNTEYIQDLETKATKAVEDKEAAEQKADEEREKALTAEKKALYYQIQAEYELDEAQEAELEKIKNNKSKLEDMLKELEDNAE